MHVQGSEDDEGHRVSVDQLALEFELRSELLRDDVEVILSLNTKCDDDDRD